MFEALIAQCAVSDAPPAVIERIIQVESGGDPIALNVNGTAITLRADKPTVESQVLRVELELAEGNNVDVGLMQINSQHFKATPDSIRAVFDTCENIRRGSEIFMRAYKPAASFYGNTELAFQSALSAYNTGTFHRGFANGYVERYEAGQTPMAPNPPREDPNTAETAVTIDFGGSVIPKE